MQVDLVESIASNADESSRAHNEPDRSEDLACVGPAVAKVDDGNAEGRRGRRLRYDSGEDGWLVAFLVLDLGQCEDAGRVSTYGLSAAEVGKLWQYVCDSHCRAGEGPRETSISCLSIVTRLTT